MPSLSVLRGLALASVVMLGGVSLARPASAGTSAPDNGTGILLLGTGTDGVYRSADGGQTWQQTSTGLPPGGVWQVQADPTLPNTAFASTGNLFRTVDGGQHWQVTPGLATSGPGFTALTVQGSLLLAAGPAGIVAGGGKRRWVLQHLAVPGGAPRLLLATGQDLLYAVDAEGALYLHGNIPWANSGDWQRLINGLPAGPITALAYEPRTAMPDTDCMVPDGCVTLYAGVAGHGLYQSLDSGSHWTSENTGLPAGATIRAIFQPQAASQQCTTYAAVEGHGLYRSRYCGQFWKPAEGPAWTKTLTITALAQVGTTIVAATQGQGVQQYIADSVSVRWHGTANGMPHNDVGLSLAWLPAPVSVTRLAPPLSTHCAATGLFHFQVCDPFLRFYQSVHPSRVIFGDALSPLEYDQTDPSLIVQYFDRARFEYRPDLAGQVRMTPLGQWLTLGRRFPQTPVVEMSNTVFFPQTGYSIGNPFLRFWSKHGGAAILGYPISSVVEEPNGDGSHRPYIMQYFQNARLEEHPEQSGTAYFVELGLLGREYLCKHTAMFCQG